jgi:hypothetical protein
MWSCARPLASCCAKTMTCRAGTANRSNTSTASHALGAATSLELCFRSFHPRSAETSIATDRVVGPAEVRSEPVGKCDDRSVPALPDLQRLSDQRVVLRDWTERDAPAVEPVCGDWDVCQFSTGPWEYSHAAARAWVARQLGRRSIGSGLALAVCRPGEAPVGNVNLVRFSDDGREAAWATGWCRPLADRGSQCDPRGCCVSGDFGSCGLSASSWRFSGECRLACRRRAAWRRARGVRPDSHQAGGRHWDMVIYSLTRPPL